ncbi:GNAT family N-acetyltransferase [Sphingosinicella sp. CPCC 101087]|uniref:GNAT family N-acetyltransferase n=1 Tax=Sphingosinicella sp. CPCC 101087 TaxID=2497754 RepID=UPI001FB103E0|nr:GNAT family N-acetyltransferase [Sphingosinicella sp. CPCC 101087]
MKIRLAAAGDAAAIASIYAPYVTGSTVSFESDPPTQGDVRGRIEGGGELYPWLVAVDDGERILGYAYACAFRTRPAYRFAVETSVYVDAAAQRRGVGNRLYAALLPLLEAQGFTQAIAAITLPNAPSVRLHEAHGFGRAGEYRDVGYKLGQWLSVGLWQRPLARPTPRPQEPRPVAAVWDGP